MGRERERQGKSLFFLSTTYVCVYVCVCDDNNKKFQRQIQQTFFLWPPRNSLAPLRFTTDFTLLLLLLFAVVSSLFSVVGFIYSIFVHGLYTYTNMFGCALVL